MLTRRIRRGIIILRWYFIDWVCPHWSRDFSYVYYVLCGTCHHMIGIALADIIKPHWRPCLFGCKPYPVYSVIHLPQLQRTLARWRCVFCHWPDSYPFPLWLLIQILRFLKSIYVGVRTLIVYLYNTIRRILPGGGAHTVS